MRSFNPGAGTITLQIGKMTSSGDQSSVIVKDVDLSVDNAILAISEKNVVIAPLETNIPAITLMSVSNNEDVLTHYIIASSK